VKYSSAVGAGFYGNEEANKGLLHFIEAADDVRETILRTESQVSTYHCHLLHCTRYTGLLKLKYPPDKKQFLNNRVIFLYQNFLIYMG